MSAAQLDLESERTCSAEGATSSALKEQVAARLAAHRARRGSAGTAPEAKAAARVEVTRGRSAEIAAAVKQRYEHSPSYRSVLAEEAARALHRAEAAAEVASINARAIARAQQQLLAELGDWHEPQANVSSIPISAALPAAQPAAAAAAILAQQKTSIQRRTRAPKMAEESPIGRVVLRPEPARADLATASSLPAPQPAQEVASAGYTVRLYENANRSLPEPTVFHAPLHSAPEPDDHEAQLLEEELAFRLDPAFAESTAPQPIPANLIAFPRQLVAARKARPRLAEGPLREDALDEPAQLRIFEVEAEHISAAPMTDADAPEWTSILLSAQPEPTFPQPLDIDTMPALAPEAAPLSRRVMAAAVDACLVLSSVLAAGGVFTLTATHLTNEPLAVPLAVAAATALGTIAVFATLYHLLFFTYTEATPGMRYARIALCTLSDENPTRSAMRRRFFAMLLSVFPLGLGYLWAFVDEDGLGWHDRMSRMYQRAY